MSNQLVDIVARDIIFILDTKGNVASVLLTPEKYEYLLDRVDEIVVEYNEEIAELNQTIQELTQQLDTMHELVTDLQRDIVFLEQERNMASLQRGLDQSAEGKVVDKGSFVPYQCKHCVSGGRYRCFCEVVQKEVDPDDTICAHFIKYSGY